MGVYLRVYPIGAHTFGFVWECEARASVRQLGEAGFRRIQFLALPPHLNPFESGPGLRAGIKREIEAIGGEVIAIDLPSSETNLASSFAEVVDFGVAAYAKAIELAADIGANWITINSGRKHGLLPPPDSRQTAIYRNSLERIVRVAESLNIRILIENLPGMQLSRAAEINSFLDEGNYGLVDVLYDVANAVAVGEDPVDGLRELGSKTKVVHLSDSMWREWRHDPIGAGRINFAAIRLALDEAEYNGLVVIETTSKSALTGIIRSKEALEAQGWQFR
jgi:deoxyribonuclease-4